jgi:hypothetical protein
MADKGRAFVKGGLGCLLGFLAIGLLFVLLGGYMRIDLGGAILLFVIGGVIGLIVLAIYRKGYAEGRGEVGGPPGPGGPEPPRPD